MINSATYKIDKPCYLCGDIHGDFRRLTKVLADNDVHDAAVIVLGDIGMFNKRSYRELSELFDTTNDYYLIRGNHDNPEYWDRFCSTQNVTFVKDFSAIEFNGLRFIVLGGAISIDRIYRVCGSSWWIDEPLPYAGIQHTDFSSYNGVLAHAGLKPLNLPSNEAFQSLIKSTPNMERDLDKEKDVINKIIEENNNLKYWFHGHFHVDDIQEVKGCKCVALGIESLIDCSTFLNKLEQNIDEITK